MPVRSRMVGVSRRQIIAGAGGVFLASPAMAGLFPTPSATRGPFYPRRRLSDVDADLTLIDGRAERARGIIIEVTGRVIRTTGEPVPGALVEIWQANMLGDYADRESGEPAKSDRNFQGYGEMPAGRDGMFRFRTVKPGAYDLGGGARRTPHIHLIARAARMKDLATQIYFPGEPLNDQDILLRRYATADERARVTASAIGGDPHRLRFDIVLGA